MISLSALRFLAPAADELRVIPAGRVAAVVLNFRGWPAIATTVCALGDELPWEDIMVVDNASEDGSADRVAGHFPGVRLIRSPVNDGYAGGMNLGVSAADPKTEFVLLVTHECVLEPGALHRLVETLETHQRAALAAPLLGQASSGTVWSAGGIVKRRSGQPHHLGAGESVEALRGDDSHDVEWADGAALLVRRRALEAVGGLDERFFLYDEEVDLAVRLRARGWNIRLVPGAVAWQEPGVGGTPVYLEVRNRLLLWRFNEEWRLGIAAVVYTGWQVLDDLAHRRLARAGLRLAGLRDGLTGHLDHRRALLR